MRTTLSLDPDVAKLIELEVQSTKRSMKEVINEKLRRGFALNPKQDLAKASHLPSPLKLGKPKVQNFDDIAGILDWIEDDSR